MSKRVETPIKLRLREEDFNVRETVEAIEWLVEFIANDEETGASVFPETFAIYNHFLGRPMTVFLDLYQRSFSVEGFCSKEDLTERDLTALEVAQLEEIGLAAMRRTIEMLVVIEGFCQKRTPLKCPRSQYYTSQKLSSA